jgi:hypothetical protein
MFVRLMTYAVIGNLCLASALLPGAPSSPAASALGVQRPVFVSAQALEPFPGAPACPTHNRVAYHGLWDSERGCHYDHTHNADPGLGDRVFGPVGAVRQNISYPWMTHNENDHHGHAGYKYSVHVYPNSPVPQEGYEYLAEQGRPANYVTAWRIQSHDAGGNPHLVKRFHSYYLEVRILSVDGQTTGFLRTGGHADFGVLHLPYKVSLLAVPEYDPTPVSQSIHNAPYRGLHATLSDLSLIQRRGNGNNTITWASDSRYGWNQLASFNFRTLDSWGLMDAHEPRTEHFICPEFDCAFNNSEHHVYAVVVNIPAALDGNGDGRVTYFGYTDVKGNVDRTCKRPSAACVPLQIVNAPVGRAVFSRGNSGVRPEGEIIPDFDVSPPGLHWIGFPN